MKRNLILLITILLTTTTLAAAKKPVATKVLPPKNSIPCQILAAKNTCWNKYTVNISYQDAISQKEFQKFSIAKDKSHTTVKFNCIKNAGRMFVSNFTPEIWQGDVHRRFHSKKVWQVPNTVPDDKDFYEIRICFPDDFQGVPIPMGYLENCKCQYPKVAKKKSS